MVNFWEAWALSKGKSVGFRYPCPRKRERERERERGGSYPYIPILLTFPIRPFPLTDVSTDPENMLTMLHTWQTGDVSKQEPYNGDFSAAMKGIKAKTLVLPAKTDLYFREFCFSFLFFFLSFWPLLVQ
jgi:hypothetical protein